MQLEFIVFGAVCVILVLMFNSLIAKKNDVENAIGGVHTYLKNRSDLIPGVVATVKQYANHESKLLENLTLARTAAARGMENGSDLPAADSAMSKVFGQVYAVAENYPDLKASQNFLNLQSTLNEIEGQLSAARRSYNSAVTRYNNAIESFPSMFMARAMGYQRKPIFTVTEAEAVRPNIDQLFGNAG